MLTTAPPVPAAGDLPLTVRVLRCGGCRDSLVEDRTTWHEVHALMEAHAADAHAAQALDYGGHLRGERANRIVRSFADHAAPSVLSMDLVALRGVFCGLCGRELVLRRTTVGQLLDRITTHLAQRHSGRPRSPRELRAQHGLPAGLPTIARRSW